MVAKHMMVTRTKWGMREFLHHFKYYKSVSEVPLILHNLSSIKTKCGKQNHARHTHRKLYVSFADRNGTREIKNLHGKILLKMILISVYTGFYCRILLIPCAALEAE